VDCIKLDLCLDIIYQHTKVKLNQFRPSKVIVRTPNFERTDGRTDGHVIHYVKFNALKDTEMYYGEQLMLLSSFRKELKLVGTSDSFESQYKLLVERKHQQTPSISN